VGTIAKQLSIHEDVVKRVLGLVGRPTPAPARPRLVAPYESFIKETLDRYPTLRSTRLYDMLKPRGYPGTVRTLREHVATVRPRPTREAFLRVDPLIGEQAQVDWAHVGKVPVPGGERALWLFVMVLA
jgi:transposase